MGEQAKASLRIDKCPKDSRYIIRGRKAKIYICAGHRFRADFELLIKKGLLIVEMMNELSDTKCQAPVFKGSMTI